MDVTGKPLKETLASSMVLTNILMIHVDHDQLTNDPDFVDKMQKWVVDVKSEDEGIKIVLLVRDSPEQNIFREKEDIRDIVGDGVFEDDVSSVIMMED